MSWSNSPAASRLVFALALALTASACVRPPAPAPLPKVDTKSLAEAMRDRAAPFTAAGTIRAGGSLFGSAPTSLAVDPRKGLRVDVFTPFMTPAGTLVLKDGEAWYLNRIEGFFVRADAERLLDTLLDVPVDPSPLPWILAGGLPPFEDGWSLAARAADEPDGALVLESRGEGWRRRAVIEGDDFRLTRFSVFREADGVNIAVMRCEEHRAGVPPMPTRVRIQAPGRGVALVLTLDEIDTSAGPGDEELTIRPPVGVVLKDWR